MKTIGRTAIPAEAARLRRQRKNKELKRESKRVEEWRVKI